MLLTFWAWRAARRLRDYRPKKVTIRSINKWLSQFPKSDRKALIGLLNRVRYFSEPETERALVELNRRLLDRLAGSGISIDRVVYVQVDEAGSSSGVMLNMLRDAARLEGQGCRFLDSKDIPGLRRATEELGEGAIIYVDDFAGTGKQFSKSWQFVRQYVVGNFSEFFLLPCICEEAKDLLELQGVEPVAQHIHTIAERPLHDRCTVLHPDIKKRLRDLCAEISEKSHGLGYKRLATMVVIYTNAPNHTPLVLRGNPSQNKYIGVIPRTTDLPFHQK